MNEHITYVYAQTHTKKDYCTPEGEVILPSVVKGAKSDEVLWELMSTCAAATPTTVYIIYTWRYKIE